jgi:hypothetical protein
MKIVVRAVLERAVIAAGSSGLVLTRRRGITVSPRDGGSILLRERAREGAPALA